MSNSNSPNPLWAYLRTSHPELSVRWQKRVATPDDEWYLLAGMVTDGIWQEGTAVKAFPDDPLLPGADRCPVAEFPDLVRDAINALAIAQRSHGVADRATPIRQGVEEWISLRPFEKWKETVAEAYADLANPPTDLPDETKAFTSRTLTELSVRFAVKATLGEGHYSHPPGLLVPLAMRHFSEVSLRQIRHNTPSQLLKVSSLQAGDIVEDASCKAVYAWAVERGITYLLLLDGGPHARALALQPRE